MTLFPLLLALTIAPPSTAAAEPLPPPLPERRSVRDLTPPGADDSIFTYTIDGVCRVTDTRKLQGPEDMRWRDVDQSLDISEQNTVYRFVDGRRTQLVERRVRLLGEMVREGELVCQVRPSGDVIAAWIERHDERGGRRRTPEREQQNIVDGRIGDLGTFSVALPAP